MTDDPRRTGSKAPPPLRSDGSGSSETGTAERLAMNRTGSFEWDLDAGTLDIDEAGLMVFGLDPNTFDSRPGAVVEQLDPSERARLDVTIDEALSSGSSSYSVHFQVPLADGTRQWTHVQARILRSEDGRAHRVIGVVRDATAEVTHSAFVQDLEKRRQRQTNIVERTTSAMSRAVTVDDVTAALTGPGGLAGLGSDGLALGLVENSALNIIALSGDSVEVLGGLGSGELDANLPLGDTILSGKPRFITSLDSLIRRYPVLEPHMVEAEVPRGRLPSAGRSGAPPRRARPLLPGTHGVQRGRAHSLSGAGRHRGPVAPAGHAVRRGARVRHGAPVGHASAADPRHRGRGDRGPVPRGVERPPGRRRLVRRDRAAQPPLRRRGGRRTGPRHARCRDHGPAAYRPARVRGRGAPAA